MNNCSYGSLARIGVATPQANPTVEPELYRLLPSGVSMLVTRSVSEAPPRQRLLDYFHQIDRSLEQFGGLELDAFAFACTASSYLLDGNREAQACERISQKFCIPVITAAMAIERYLKHHGVKKILIASPYPAWIHTLSVEHWARRGFEVIAASSASLDMQDTADIYSLDPLEAAGHFAQTLCDRPADLLLITGTGLPSLSIIPVLREQLRMPVVSSNVCLAWASLLAAGLSTDLLRNF